MLLFCINLLELAKTEAQDSSFKTPASEDSYVITFYESCNIV